MHKHFSKGIFFKVRFFSRKHILPTTFCCLILLQIIELQEINELVSIYMLKLTRFNDKWRKRKKVIVSWTLDT